MLARLFARPANVLVLDEPTNDLDIDTLELLEDMLSEYQGTVFLVSHDRIFLDNVLTQVIAAQGDGQWQEYVGGYQDWLVQSQRAQAPKDAVLKPVSTSAIKPSTKEPLYAQTSSAPAKSSSAASPASKTRKLSYKEQQELAQLPEKIAALEASQTQLMQKMNDPAAYQAQKNSNAQPAQEMATELKKIETDLAQAMERWLALESTD